ncbi:MAG TPA: beta-propeller fold lactonase family protein [Gemmatimonadota bacterium]|nr:beta-propeller fold lactonase family protein [Gemmatimonadota bacterium]
MSLQAIAAALALACAAATGAAGGTRPGEGAASAAVRPAEPALLYVTNQNGASVSVIDVERKAEVARVDLQALGFGPNAKPHDTALEPDGSFWYVSLIGENRVLKFDRENRLVGQVEMEVPGLVVAHPTRDLLVVGRSMSAVNPPSSVALIRRSDMTLLDEIEVLFARPHANAVNGRYAYSASLAENRIGVIDLDTGDVEIVDLPEPATIDTAGMEHAEHAGMTPHTLVEFALSPDGRWMVAGGQISGVLMVFDLADPSAPRVVQRIQIGGAPWHPAFTTDGRHVYVPLNRANQVAVVDTGTWEVVERIQGRGIAEPHGAVPSPDGRWMFISNNNLEGTYVATGPDPGVGTVAVVDTESREIVQVIEVGPYATGLETIPASR